MEQNVEGSKWYNENEKHIADILMLLHNSQPRPFNWTWGCKKKRSAIRDPPPLAFLRPPLHHDHAAPSRDTPLRKTEVATPATLLSTQTNAKPNNPSPKIPSLKKRKGYPESIEELRRSEGWVNENKKQKQGGVEMQMAPPPMVPNWNVMCGGASQICKRKGVIISGHATRSLQMASSSCTGLGCVIVSGHATTSLQMPSSSSTGLGCINGNQGRLPLPDLNLRPDSPQPLDEIMANQDLKRALAAQARQRRILIYRSKNPSLHTKLR